MIQSRFDDIWNIFGLGETEEVFPQMFRALEDEIATEKSETADRYDARDCRWIHSNEEGYLYRISVKLTRFYPSETGISFKVDGFPLAKGLLLSYSDFEAIILLRMLVGNDIPSAEVSIHPVQVLAKLHARLKSALNLEEPESGIADATVAYTPRRAEFEDETSSDGGNERSRNAVRGKNPGMDRADACTEEMIRKFLAASPVPPDDSQQLAIRRVARYFTHCVWGPPGTGKTRTLARTVRSFVERGMTVMVLAVTNAAVDIAMAAVQEECAGTTALAEGGILRYGSSTRLEEDMHADILPLAILKRSNPELWHRKTNAETRLLEEYKKLARTRSGRSAEEISNRIRQLRNELSAHRREMQETLQAALKFTRVAGTTLARFAMEDAVWNLDRDVLIIDEASIVPFPYALAAMMRPRHGLFLFGDFRQLPPVVRSRSIFTDQWMGRDIFELSGIRRHIEQNRPDSRYTLLDTQYRMDSRIANVVSAYAYAGKVRSAPGVDDRVGTISALSPCEGEAVVVVDSGAVGSAAMRESGATSYSRANLHHALLVVQLTGIIREQGADRVAVITPYAHQARLLNALTEPLRRQGMQVTCATVHRYQGSEEDAVIIDTVDAFPLDGPSALTGKDEEIALRLFNVSASRARGKLLFILDTTFLRASHAPDSTLRKLHAHLLANGVTLDASTLAGPVFRMLPPDLDDPGAAWIAALSNAKIDVVMNLPIPGEVANGILQFAAERASRGLRVRCHAPLRTALPFEASSIDFNLLPFMQVNVLLIDGRRFLLAGRDGSAPIIASDQASLMNVAAEYLGFGGVLYGPKPTAAT